ncbi:hypothetical protein COT72_01860 [archaeon CG10_big_fil_rev_8_21_14_0_10_43_11]|nr:MAG: hypothetical protein COT72_01860 [archaeon CG10_big_fil_rev_8_21_14_0_10_43_11]
MKLHILNPLLAVETPLTSAFSGLIEEIAYDTLEIPFECRNELSKFYANGTLGSEDRKLYDKDALFAHLNKHHAGKNILLFLDGPLVQSTYGDYRAINGFYQNGHALVAGDMSEEKQRATGIHELGHHYDLKHHSDCVMQTGHPKPETFCSECTATLESLVEETCAPRAV